MRKTLIAALVGLGLTTCLTVTAGPQYNTAVDITSIGASGNGTTLDGATFNFADPRPTGTGFIDPFLREQIENSGAEWGVNTSIKSQIMNNNTGTGTLDGTIWENKSPVNFTHDLAVSSLMPVNGKVTFMCDVNQVANGSISLTTFKVYIYNSATPFTDPTALNNWLGTANPVVDINRGLTGSGSKPLNQVNATSNTGSGSGDLSVTFPLSATSGFLYLVAAFGQNGSDFVANGGFEEWWTSTTTPNTAPDTASALSLLGIAITGIEIFRRKLRA